MTAGAKEGRIVDDLFRRWKTLQLVEPIFTLTVRGAARADLDHARYDVKALALDAIDFVVAKQASFDEGAATLNRLEDHLRDRARLMYPDDPDRGWVTITRLVLDMLLNDGQAYRYEWRPPDGSDPVPWRFRLLRMIDTGEGTSIAATDESIVLYLQALDVDLADREMATKLMLSRQMEAGEFNRARASAVEARRYAEGVATQLRERLDDTRRDLRTVDWESDMPRRLSDALGTVVEQIDLDRHIIALAESGVDSDDLSSALACRSVLAEVRRSQDVHVRLEQEIIRAVPVYLEAQERQRLRPRGIASLVDLTADLLDPLIAAPADRVTAVGDVLARAGMGARVEPCFAVRDALAVLLRPIESRIRPDPVVDVPDDLVDIDDDNVSEPVAAAAANHLAAGTKHGPVRLSHLLATIATTSPAAIPYSERPEVMTTADTGGIPEDNHHEEPAPGSSRDPGPSVPDVVWAGSLWAWVNTSAGADEDGDCDEGTQPRNRHLAGVLATLAAVDDGTRLAGGFGYTGADLLVGRAHHLVTNADPIGIGAHDLARIDRANEERVSVP